MYMHVCINCINLYINETCRLSSNNETAKIQRFIKKTRGQHIPYWNQTFGHKTAKLWPFESLVKKRLHSCLQKFILFQEVNSMHI